MMTALRQRSLDAALAVADRLAEPTSQDTVADHTAAAVLHTVTAPWRSCAIARVRLRLRLAVQHLPSPVPAGVWTGLGGVVFAVDLAAQAFGGYGRIRDQGIERLVNHTTGMLRVGHANGRPYAAADLDLVSGLTGIARLMLAAHQDGDHSVRSHLAAVLRLLTTTITEPTAWRGDGVAHGVAGPLAVLTLAHRAGVSTPDQRAAIALVARRLANAEHPHWHAFRRAAWCSGNPGISHTLTLAAAALNDSALDQAAYAKLTALAELPPPVLSAPGICHGLAGALLTVCAANQRTTATDLHTLADSLAEATLTHYQPDAARFHPPARAHPNGLLTGDPGVALTLMQYACPTQPWAWSRPLLIC
jgi:lantibiotic modifying enzyme